MNTTSFTAVQAGGFDLFRLSKSKEVADVCSNTIRAYMKRGLPSYRQGKAIFISKTELEQFIRASKIAA